MNAISRSFLPTRIIWHDTKERSKTSWLLHGLKELGIPIVRSNKLVERYKPRSNRLGLYVYPIEIHFGEKRVVVMLDINTIPNMVFGNMVAATKYYFKVHASKMVLDNKRIILFPNSASSLEYLSILEELRFRKDEKHYPLDFFFIGWHDDDGLRLWTVKKARAQTEWRVRAGCLPFKHHTRVDPKLQLPRMNYRGYLNTHAATKMNLALPGGGSLPFMSFRHVELMGIGCAVLTRRPTSVPFRQGVFDACVIYYDQKNFVDVVNHYLQNEKEREIIAMKARLYYEDFLSPRAHALFLISTILRKEKLF